MVACERRGREIVGDFVDATVEPLTANATPPAGAANDVTTNEDLGTDDGVVRAFDTITHARCTTAKDCLCIHRGKEFPDLVAVATVRAGGSCKLEGFFFRRVWYDAIGPATRLVFSELGWDGATRSRRVDLAMAWTREVMLHFEGIVDERPAAFTVAAAPRFHPLEATWEPTGAIEVRAYVVEDSAYSIAYREEILRFDPAGRAVKTGVGNFFTATMK